ncbi:hypothetical protein R80B4_01288 [Fibrobacteres bacterium R8-0-B4]
MAVTINVKLKPRASKCAINVCGPKDIEVSVTSPPVDNRANEQLIECLADVLRVAKSSLSIVKGGHSRNKVVLIEGIGDDEVFRRLSVI